MNCLKVYYDQEEQSSVHLTRDELVVSHLPLVKFIVNQIASTLPHHLDRDDLRSAAVTGLISSAERFDPSRDVQFKTFAEKRIKGTILDELRAQDWLPRGLRDKLKKLERETWQLVNRLGRGPSSEEVAEAMGLDLQDYFQLLNKIHQHSTISLDEALLNEEGSGFDLLGILEDKGGENPQSRLIEKQTAVEITEAINNLPETERIVITLYYYEELNLKEIGAMLNLTESRISQLHSQAIIRLRVMLKRSL